MLLLEAKEQISNVIAGFFNAWTTERTYMTGYFWSYILTCELPHHRPGPCIV